MLPWFLIEYFPWGAAVYPLKISLGSLFLKFDGSGLSSSLGGSSGGDVGWHDFKSSTFGCIGGKSGVASKYLSHSLPSSSLNLTGVE